MLKSKNIFRNIIIISVLFTLISCSGSSNDLPQTDQTTPVVVSVSPVEGQLDVLETDNITVTFDEDIKDKDFKLSSIVIKRIDVTPSVTLTDPIITSKYSANTKTLTFTPRPAALKANARYRILVRNIEDSAGNPIIDKTWEFETVTNPDGEIIPSNGVLGVSPASSIKITFSKAMDVTSLMVVDQTTAEQNPINFTLTEASVVVPNKNILFSYDAQSNTATYKLKTAMPNQYGFKISTVYQVVLANSAFGANGIRLTNEITTVFTTGVNTGLGTKPAKPQNVFVDARRYKANIIWEEVIGTAVSYNLYLSIDGGVNFDSVGLDIQGTIQTNPAAATTIAFSYPMTIDTPHLFAITAVDNNVESVFALANEVRLVPAPLKPTGLNVTTNITAANVPLAIISWDNVDNIKYNLSVSVDGGEYLPVKNNNVIVGPITGTVGDPRVEFTHTDITAGLTYQYQLVAENAQGSLSQAEFSLVVSFVLKTPAPENVTAVADDSIINLTWSAPLQADPEKPLTGFTYKVYMSKDAGITYNLMSSSAITGTSFKLRVTNNIPYYIAVSAIVPNRNESDKSIANKNASVTPLIAATRIASHPDIYTFTGYNGGHTCIIRPVTKGEKAGGLWCWGENYLNQSDNGKTAITQTPIQVGAVPVGSTTPAIIWNDWIAVSVGRTSSCGIRKINGVGPGLLYCWGNRQGISTPVVVQKPVSLASTTQVNWTKISSSSFFNCAIHSGTDSVGELFCWGSGNNGELGNGISGPNTPSVSQPEPVLGSNGSTTPDTDWIEISLGRSHACGIRQETPTNTTLWCWGLGSLGQLGDNDPVIRANSGSAVPIQEYTHQTNWTSVAAGNNYSCAVNAKDNSLWCWGSNAFGGLGTGNFDVSYTLKQEATLANDWIKVFVDSDSTCGLKSNGQLNCWGRNDFGQTGTQSSRRGNTIPQVLSFDTDWLEVSADEYNTCAVNSLDQVACWGRFIQGSNAPDSIAPSGVYLDKFKQLFDIADISVSSYGVSNEFRFNFKGPHVLALQKKLGNSNVLYSWGDNYSDQVGAGKYNLFTYQKPTKIETPIDNTINIHVWKKISAGRQYSCAISAIDNSLWCWGRGNVFDVPTNPKQIGTEQWRDIATTESQICGIKLVTDNTLPGDQSMWCWGNNDVGQLGVGFVSTAKTIPQKVLSPLATEVKWQSVSITRNTVCAITVTGDLYCWGLSTGDVLGNGITPVVDQYKPTLVVLPTPTTMWKKVKITMLGTCALTTLDQLYCWGNDKTIMGVTTSQSTPLLISGGRGSWLDFDLGYSRICAVDAVNLELWCWGKLDNNNVTTPKFFDGGLINWKKVFIGESFTCGIGTGSTGVNPNPNAVWCWGKNDFGQLGNGNAFTTKPIPVVFP